MTLLHYSGPLGQASFSNSTPSDERSNTLLSDGSDAGAVVWAQRIRIDRRHGVARFVVELTNGHTFVALVGEPESLDVDDVELTTEALDAVDLWSRHVRTYIPRRRPPLPTRRVGFPRDREHRKHIRHCDQVIAA